MIGGDKIATMVRVAMDATPKEQGQPDSVALCPIAISSRVYR